MVVAVLVLSAAPAWERGGGGVEAYRYGDYVQTAWRGQLGEMRTQWQDVVAEREGRDDPLLLLQSRHHAACDKERCRVDPVHDPQPRAVRCGPTGAF